MQPRVTVALATVWLTVAGLVGGAVTLRLSHDQYSPATPRHHVEVQRDQTRDWRDHKPAENQPLDLWIGSQRSISAKESPVRDGKFVERDFPFEMPLKNIASSKWTYPLSDWQKWLPNITGAEFAADKVDYGYEMPETLSREVVVPPSDLLDDPFVADDTFQDQGPGSVEIYKLDLSKEKALLTATTPSTNSPSRNKSKAPKKTGHLSTKTKTTEIKSTTMSPEIHHRQSNFFEEQRTETPSVNRDSFGVGGVPELQVGCEGLEALSSHKAKRSIDTPGNENEQVTIVALPNVTPVSLDLDYDVSYEESYEEMDELFKLKKLETTTKGNKPNRGDMDASYLNSDHLDESKRSDKLPVRGDLGESTSKNTSEPKIDPQNEPQKPPDSKIKKHEEIKAKRESLSPKDDDGTSSENRGRRLLWLAEANTEALADGKSERKRARRSIDWGYGENEGVVSSDELQTLSQRRRQHDIRYHQDVSGRRDQHQNGVNLEIDNIRREHEKLLEQRRREDEERQRRMQQGGRSRWEEERRRDETQRRQHEDYNERTNRISTSRADDEDTQQRQVEEQMEEQQTQKPERDRTLKIARRNEEEQKRRQEEELRRRQYNKWQESTRRMPESVTSASDEERRRLYDEQIRKRQEEERQRRLREEEARRQEQYRWQEELRRRKDEEERRRQENSSRNLSENDRRRFEEHRRESEKRRQEEENERRRQQAPSNLRRPESPRISNPNDIRQRDRDEERRAQEQEERRREQKLREYIARNRPINVSHAEGRSEEERRHNRPEESRDPRVSANRNDEEYRRRAEEQRRRQDEERRLQDYIRRNQPVNVPSRSNQSTATDRNLFEERRLIEEARRRDRYPDPGARRQHGPSASTYIDPRSSPEEVRRRQQETARRLEEERRQRYETEERRKELARRQQEKEEERRQREERMRKEAARREEEARREQSRRYEEDRKRQEEARKLQEEARLVALQRRREEARISVKGTRQPEATRSTYYENRLLEHRRRQDSRPIPHNLVRNQNDRRIAAERERQRQEAARRQQEERTREDRQKGTADQWRRHEAVRLNSLPVSATIIVRPGGTSRPVSPAVIGSRSGTTGLDNEIDFTGINPHREGVKVPQFPVPPTRKPPAQSPGPCVWAVVQCCSTNRNRLVKCFESMGCPGVNWDPNPCRSSVANAARMEVMKFYENQ